MKVLTYRLGDRKSYGVAVDGGVVDGGKRLGERYPDLRAVIEAGALDELRDATDGQPVDAGLDEITFLPVLENPDKILMVGLNYKAHREEAGRDPADHPSIFTRFPDSQVGHNQPALV